MLNIEVTKEEILNVFKDNIFDESELPDYDSIALKLKLREDDIVEYIMDYIDMNAEEILTELATEEDDEHDLTFIDGSYLDD